MFSWSRTALIARRNRTYGDIMGRQYNLRIQMDKEKREYYNTEVEQLLGMKESHKSDPKESRL